MKKLWALQTGLLVLMVSSTTTHAAQTARATLFCWSFRFHQGETSFGDSTLNLGTLPGAPNGELAPSASAYTHQSGFVVDWMGFPMNGQIYVNLPPFADANGNGFDDSFEVSQAASGSSTGEYTTVLGGGMVSATWSRGAGSKDGTCWLRLVDNAIGDLGTFQHPFEVLEYTGSLTYTPGSNSVSGILSVTNAADQLLGTLSFTKSITNPYNRLTLQTAPLTNLAQQAFSLFSSSVFNRDASLGTNYYGGLEFNDGDLNTVGEDYFSWELSIDDLNDGDHDGIPDFSDDPAAIAPPRQPGLALAPGPTQLLLTISGDVGRLHRILETTNLAAGNWLTNLSLTLTNDPQIVSLPLPSGPLKFWRVTAE